MKILDFYNKAVAVTAKASEAMKKGKQLQNSEAWKNAGIVSSAIAVFVQPIASLLGSDISTAEISGYINYLYMGVLVFNTYVHVSTSKTVGI